MSERKHPFDLSADIGAIMARIDLLVRALDIVQLEGVAIADDAERLAGRLESIADAPEMFSAAAHLREMAAKLRLQTSKLERVGTLQ